MNDTIEVRLELTQKEADAVALALRACGTQRGWYKSEIALFERVAQEFRNATRDAGWRDSDEAYVNWLNKCT